MSLHVCLHVVVNTFYVCVIAYLLTSCDTGVSSKERTPGQVTEERTGKRADEGPNPEEDSAGDTRQVLFSADNLGMLCFMLPRYAMNISPDKWSTVHTRIYLNTNIICNLKVWVPVHVYRSIYLVK